MKPWEETWTATERSDEGCNDVINGQPTEVFLKGGSDRFNLALAAPEMARLLLELEWAGCNCELDSGGEDACPVCHEDAPSEHKIPARRLDAFTREEAHTVKRGGVHAKDCTLATLLVKAGVR